MMPVSAFSPRCGSEVYPVTLQGHFSFTVHIRLIQDYIYDTQLSTIEDAIQNDLRRNAGMSNLYHDGMGKCFVKGIKTKGRLSHLKQLRRYHKLMVCEAGKADDMGDICMDEFPCKGRLELGGSVTVIVVVFGVVGFPDDTLPINQD